jgi:hypothetical protein
MGQDMHQHGARVAQAYGTDTLRLLCERCRGPIRIAEQAVYRNTALCTQCALTAARQSNVGDLQLSEPAANAPLQT